MLAKKNSPLVWLLSFAGYFAAFFVTCGVIRLLGGTDDDLGALLFRCFGLASGALLAQVTILAVRGSSAR